MHALSHRRLARAACALALVLALAPSVALAAPFLAFPQPAATQSVTVEIAQATPSVQPDGALRTSVAVTLGTAAEYVEVRVRLRGPSGTLLYQKTEVRSDLPAGRHVVTYDYDLGRLGLRQGRYPIEVRVLATGSEQTNVTSRLLVVDPTTAPLPVALVVGVAGSPAVGIDGRFGINPASDTTVRDDISFLTQLALDRRQPLALAVPPVLVEQLARTAAGYETTAGVAVPADAEVPTRYARALADLRSAVASGTVGLLDVPYALPDLAGLARIGRPGDIAAHWERSDAALASALQSVTTSTTAYVGDSLTPDALATLAGRNAPALLTSREAVRTGDGVTTPGCYAVDGTDAAIIVADDDIATAVAAGADAFYDAAFERLEDPGCTVVFFRVGDGGLHDPVDVQHALDWIAAVPWVEVVPVGAISGTEPAPAAVAQLEPSAEVRWDAVGRARDAAEAYAMAVGPGDTDAAAVRDATLVAESALWAADGDHPGEADALATAAADFVSTQFASVVIDAKDVTLSGRRGDVPFTLMNGTGKTLELTLVASAPQLKIRKPQVVITAQPDENFVTIPVDLRSIISDDLRVSVRAGNVTVAETSVTVRASYLDRIATIGIVLVVLVGLLLFIRRRVRTAFAGTIPGSDGPDHDGPVRTGQE